MPEKVTDDNYRSALLLLIAEGRVSLDEATSAIMRAREMGPAVGPTWRTADELIVHFNAELVKNNRRPFKATQQARSLMERMLRIDKFAPEHIRDIITWTCADDFWGAVILSPLKLRKHLPTLEARMRAPVKPVEPPNRPPMYDPHEFEKRRSESVPMPSGFKSALRGSG